MNDDFGSNLSRKSAALSLGTLLCPYDIAYRGAYELSTSKLFLNPGVVRCVDRQRVGCTPL